MIVIGRLNPEIVLRKIEELGKEYEDEGYDTYRGDHEFHLFSLGYVLRSYGLPGRNIHGIFEECVRSLDPRKLKDLYNNLLKIKVLK